MNYFTNEYNKRRFTEILEELVCVKKLDLKNALSLMSRAMSDKRNQRNAVPLAAQNIYSALLNGQEFSNALKVCPYIDFDVVYISFTCFAERCGCLERVLQFLKNKCVRKNENLSTIAGAAVYPVFVIMLAVGAGILLYYYSAATQAAATSDFNIILLTAFSFLFSFCAVMILILKKILGTNKLYEAFLAMGFLIKGGECIANAVTAAVNILGFETREGRLFAQAGEKLSYGLSLRESFSLNTPNQRLRRQLEEAFFYAENSGGENDVFEKIALWLNARDEKRRAICMKLIEPIFISGTGIFLLIFLVNLVLPMFSEGTFFL
ncbi:MAG: type II secretion system F family protein [Treponema sp.]|nr:type II secretion system F family protein [Treponema sp.]